MLGLDRGGACRGIAFRVAPADWDGVQAYLREREQVTAVYLERMREIRFADGSMARALTYLVDRRHAQYAGKLDEETQFRIVAGAHGRSGANSDYVVNTAAHLAELGMPDPLLARLAERLHALDPGARAERRDEASGGEPQVRRLGRPQILDDRPARLQRGGEEVQVDRRPARRRVGGHARERRHFAGPDRASAAHRDGHPVLEVRHRVGAGAGEQIAPAGTAGPVEVAGGHTGRQRGPATRKAMSSFPAPNMQNISENTSCNPKPGRSSRVGFQLPLQYYILVD